MPWFSDPTSGVSEHTNPGIRGMTCVNVGCDGLGRVTTRPGARTCGLVGGCAVDGCEVEAGRFGQVERGQNGLLVAGGGRALGDAAVGGGEGDQVHAVEFVA